MLGMKSDGPHFGYDRKKDVNDRLLSSFVPSSCSGSVCKLHVLLQ